MMLLLAAAAGTAFGAWSLLTALRHQVCSRTALRLQRRFPQGQNPAFAFTVLIVAWQQQCVVHGQTTAQFEWAVKGGGSASDVGNAIAVSGSAVVVTGYLAGTAAFGSTSLTSSGSADLVIASVSLATGVYNWAVKGGGMPGVDAGAGIAVSGSEVVVTGYFYGTAAFGSTSLTSSGGYYYAGNDDLVIAKTKLVCAAGYFGPSGEPSCENCDAGKFKALTAQSSCDGCDTGKFKALTAQSSDTCDDCDAGKFTNLTAQSSDTCDGCAAGKINTNTAQASDK
jgi:hypothetical protein